MANHVDALLSRFERALTPERADYLAAESIADAVLAMPYESRADLIAQIAAWLTALDQVAAGRLASLLPSPSTRTQREPQLGARPAQLS